jgi:beta-phosphoglucomutase-like phosphatase (HAD superfamily)
MKLFDLDGTLIDSNGVWLQIDLDFLSARGLPYSRSYSDYVSHVTYQQAAQYTKDCFQLAESTEEIMAVWSDMALDAYTHHIPLKDGVLDYLEQEVRKGESLAIVTSCMDHLCHAVLHRHGILDLFAQITTVREVARDKKFPDIYLLAARKAGVSPAGCTMFEDSPSAAQGAKSAGMRVVGVYDPFFAPYEEELRRSCDGYIHSFRELLTT